MQNRYVGDIGDFAKHGLLRFLSGITDDVKLDPKLQLGLIWYMYHEPKEHPPGGNVKVIGDGGHTGYLARIPGDDRSEFRDCDPELWEALRDLVFRGARCVHCVEEAGILPKDTLYYNAALQYVPKMKQATKREIRDHWLRFALRATEGAELVCVDPDNGLAQNTEKMYREQGPKFVYLDDLRALWERGQSLVLYQHTARNGDAEEQIKAKTDTLRGELQVNSVTALRFRSISSRTFYVLSQPEHEEIVRQRAGRFLGGPWGNHFEWVP